MPQVIRLINRGLREVSRYYVSSTRTKHLPRGAMKYCKLVKYRLKCCRRETTKYLRRKRPQWTSGTVHVPRAGRAYRRIHAEEKQDCSSSPWVRDHWSCKRFLRGFVVSLFIELPTRCHQRNVTWFVSMDSLFYIFFVVSSIISIVTNFILNEDYLFIHTVDPIYPLKYTQHILKKRYHFYIRRCMI